MSARDRPPSLRSTLAWTTALFAVVAVLVSAALVALTTILHRNTVSAAASVESVRLADEAEIALLLHQRAEDPVLRQEIEGNLRRTLASAGRFVTTEDEARVLAEARSHVDAYIASSRHPELPPAELAAHHSAAFGALDALIDVNVAQAGEAEVSAARWDELANVIGIAMSALLLLVGGGVVVWLRWRAFAPVFSLAAAMDRFAKGDRDARAEEHGPAELRAMSRRFNELADALAAERRSQMAFLGGVAHDLRNPLSVLKLAMTSLPPGEPLPPEPRLRATLQRIDRQITHLERMAGDFLDMAKIDAGELELKRGTHDARSLVRDVLDLFEGAASAHRIHVSLPDEVVPLHCDHVRIEQVVTNLISNAIKYSPPGTSIEVAVDGRGDEVVIRVADQGVGISEEDKKLVFEPFRRVGLSKEAVPGVGLGLFVVRRIVEAHGGRIDVESAPGAGSTFRVCLPAAATNGRRREPRPVTRSLEAS